MRFIGIPTIENYDVFVSVITKSGKEISYVLRAVYDKTKHPDLAEVGPGLAEKIFKRVGLVNLEPDVAEKIINSESVRKLCEVLTDSVRNCLMDKEHTLLADMINHPDENAEKIRNLQPDFEIWKKHFYKSEKTKKQFTNKVKWNCKNISDVEKVIIKQKYYKSGKYCSQSIPKDIGLMYLAKRIYGIPEKEEEEREKATAEFVEYIKKSDHLFLDEEDEDLAACIAEDLYEGYFSRDEVTYEIQEIDIAAKEVNKHTMYCL